ncbi:hypothetical protein VNO80_19931 [Phaseolus coccineus]|uniref:Uncharacterized protein n=1 Tax=Phaseolus coccineus TaxID=3886 RepID=A0AAN9R0A6_PHACN
MNIAMLMVEEALQLKITRPLAPLSVLLVKEVVEVVDEEAKVAEAVVEAGIRLTIYGFHLGGIILIFVTGTVAPPSKHGLENSSNKGMPSFFFSAKKGMPSVSRI